MLPDPTDPTQLKVDSDLAKLIAAVLGAVLVGGGAFGFVAPAMVLIGEQVEGEIVEIRHNHATCRERNRASTPCTHYDATVAYRYPGDQVHRLGLRVGVSPGHAADASLATRQLGDKIPLLVDPALPDSATPVSSAWRNALLPLLAIGAGIGLWIALALGWFDRINWTAWSRNRLAAIENGQNPLSGFNPSFKRRRRRW